MISAEKVIVTIFVKLSLNNITVASIIKQPWYIDFHIQIKKVFVDKALPFYRVR